MLLGILHYIPEILSRWPGKILLLGLACAAAVAFGWVRGAASEQARTELAETRLARTQEELAQSRRQAEDLAAALEGSRANSADIMTRLIQAERLAARPAQQSRSENDGPKDAVFTDAINAF